MELLWSTTKTRSDHWRRPDKHPQCGGSKTSAVARSSLLQRPAGKNESQQLVGKHEYGFLHDKVVCFYWVQRLFVFVRKSVKSVSAPEPTALILLLFQSCKCFKCRPRNVIDRSCYCKYLCTGLLFFFFHPTLLELVPLPLLLKCGLLSFSLSKARFSHQLIKYSPAPIVPLFCFCCNSTCSFYTTEWTQQRDTGSDGGLVHESSHYNTRCQDIRCEKLDQWTKILHWRNISSSTTVTSVTVSVQSSPCVAEIWSVALIKAAESVIKHCTNPHEGHCTMTRKRW